MITNMRKLLLLGLLCLALWPGAAHALSPELMSAQRLVWDLRSPDHGEWLIMDADIKGGAKFTIQEQLDAFQSDEWASLDRFLTYRIQECTDVVGWNALSSYALGRIPFDDPKRVQKMFERTFDNMFFEQCSNAATDLAIDLQEYDLRNEDTLRLACTIHAIRPDQCNRAHTSIEMARYSLHGEVLAWAELATKQWQEHAGR